jgi:AcrR family transcriptional regulator
MQDRRRRILDVARRLVAEKGFEGFSMRELGQRADVALRTLYNAYGSRDQLMAEAIQEYFQDFVSRRALREEAGTLKGTLERMEVVHRRNLQIKNYTRALMALYFSAGTDPELWQTIHDILDHRQRLWLGRLAEADMLHAWVDVPDAAARLTNLEYAAMFQWGQGRIDDADLIDALKRAVLTYVAGLTRGQAHDDILGELKRLTAP